MANIRKKITPKGAELWEVRIRRRGYPDISKSFKKESEAKRYARKQESLIDEGKQTTRSAERYLVTDAIDGYIDEIDSQVPRLATADNKIGELRTLRHDFEKYTIPMLTRDVISEYLKTLAKTHIPPRPNKTKSHPLYNGDAPRLYSPATIRKFYFSLKQAIEWHSRKERYHIDHDLFVGHAVPSGWAGQRDRRLNPGELQLLHNAIDKKRSLKEEWRRLIDFALETAMRDHEMLRAKWSDLNLEGRTLNIPAKNTKTRKMRQVPLSTKAAEILKVQQAQGPEGESRIFHSWSDSAAVSKGFHAIAFRAGIPELKFHDLRHEATSLLFEKKNANGSYALTVMQIMKITGHTEISTIERYTHLRPSELAALLD